MCAQRLNQFLSVLIIARHFAVVVDVLLGIVDRILHLDPLVQLVESSEKTLDLRINKFRET